MSWKFFDAVHVLQQQPFEHSSKINIYVGESKCFQLFLFINQLFKLMVVASIHYNLPVVFTSIQ